MSKDKKRLWIVELAPQTEEMFARCIAHLKPPPGLTLSQWADTYRMLSAESSPTPGPWHTDNAPYQREIMDAMGDPHVRKVVVMTAAQIGKTAMLMNVLGYYMHYYPAPVMMMEPTIEMGQTLSKDNLAPMIRDTPVLRGLVNIKSRYSGNTILKKNFPGGHVTIVGANSPVGLRMRPIKVLLADEVDGYPESAGTEGDPLLLAMKRQTVFWDKKTIIVSTPTIKGHSKIDKEFMESTREEWTIPCPGCGHYQPLAWRNVNFEDYRKDPSKPILYQCERCGKLFGEYEWKEQGKLGRFRAENPTAETRGFHLNTLASSFCGWKDVVDKFISANEQMAVGNIEEMKTWINTELGETWEEPGEHIDENKLISRRELYDAEVPEDVLVLTAAVDVQKDRFEVEVVGWGVGKESWGIRYQKIYGDTKQDKVWGDLDTFLLTPFHKKDGTPMYIQACCVDSGYRSVQVYRFTVDKFDRRVFAIKGKGGQGIPYFKNPTTDNRLKTPLFTIGVDEGKDILQQRLQHTVRDPSITSGPNYCHFPLNPEAGYDETYFKGLTSEMKIVRFRRGQMIVSWDFRDKNYKRNEPWDLRNYATAALEIYNPPLQKPETGAGQPLRRRGWRKLSNGIGGV